MTSPPPFQRVLFIGLSVTGPDKIQLDFFWQAGASGR